MAKPSKNGTQVTLSSAKVWYDAKQDQMHLTVNDPDMPGGMHIVFNPNDSSVNHHPINYNKSGALLAKHGKPTSDYLADESVKRIKRK